MSRRTVDLRPAAGLFFLSPPYKKKLTPCNRFAMIAGGRIKLS